MNNRFTFTFAAAAFLALSNVSATAAGSAIEALGPVRGTAAPEPAAPQPADSAPERLFSPERYNALIWNGRSKGDWYEWWYYKVVVPGTGRAFYFCYGVVNPWDKERSRPASRSYVSAGNFEAGETHEQNFPVKSFQADRASTFVRIGENHATDRGLSGRLPLPGGEEFSWDLSLEKDWAYNAMGWTMYKPGISNIFWYPAQASAYMSGTIRYRGKSFTLDRAPAYQDRNWGESFPEWWAWLVSNHFKGSPGTVLAAGGGMPKVLGGINLPNAMGIGLRHNGREYIFRPGRGDIIRLDINFGKWEVSAFNRSGERIEISAHAPREKFLLLKFMAPDGTEFYDYEALKGVIEVKLYSGGKLVSDLETEEGGIEFGSADPQEFSRLFTGPRKLQ